MAVCKFSRGAFAAKIPQKRECFCATLPFAAVLIIMHKVKQKPAE